MGEKGAANSPFGADYRGRKLPANVQNGGVTRRGKESVWLPNGEERRFLEDGDEIVLRGYCERAGAVRIGFGECRGVIGAAVENPRSHNRERDPGD